MKILESFLDWWKQNHSNYSAALLDIDGTLLLGNVPIPNSDKFISFLKNTNFPFLLLTNDSIRSTSEKRALLKKTGMNITPDEIISCGDAIKYVAEHFQLKGKKFLMLGTFGTPNYAEQHGIVITRDIREVDECYGVIVGELNYDWESYIVTAINFFIKNRQALLIVPNPDSFWRSGIENNIHIGAGGIGRFICHILREYGIEKEPVYLGKPHEIIYLHTIEALKRRKLLSDEKDHKKIFVLGDSIKSDIMGAVKMGFTSGLLLTGVTTEESLQSHTIKADFIYRKI
ncbi:MAG TPA: hypothetical protein DD381_04380 [Lentisphaeria bacterium]|nr:MAG: hypothetical protein A2X47_07270 [Lentisphaerae bacterium GWF2_38_69]HBM15569.1 hypothetical protein [Lentisphaeria bacterium]